MRWQAIVLYTHGLSCVQVPGSSIALTRSLRNRVVVTRYNFLLSTLGQSIIDALNRVVLFFIRTLHNAYRRYV